MTAARVLPALLVVALLLAVGARALRPAPAETREALYLFGTLVEIEIRGVPEAQARAAIAGLGRDLQQMHRDWHAWRPGMLGRLNAAIAAGQPMTVDPALAALLAEGQRLSCLSEGLFDPAVGGLVAAWGFHADTPPEGAAPPEDAVIDALLAARPRMADLRIAGTEVRSVNPAVQLDLGAYAKGAALDLAADRLQGAGIRDAVLNAGGGVQVIGRHGARPWRVAIRDPFAWGVVGTVSLRPGEALHSSGNYERFFDMGGVRFSHLLDPRSGRPVQGIVSASVLADQGALADAAATALAVAGPEDWPRIAAMMGVTAALMITDDGAILATPAMMARLESAPGGFPAPVKVVALPAPLPASPCPGP
ncbi:FAD:protein FMN transferase [Frigidibacter mobilis]|uniref:FAD:protein FMN transferase n=1 Tax=Frigidibacter mobilis TaxID=1335048 RepID=A0A159Z3I9_9RHOB|nr:FAD:protein FMN transferase [Frigidibacter mobilis]AMY68798.1 nitrogen fixation protein RnfF [Frigidibacter mobilis]